MSKIKHGFCGTRIYKTWKNMKARCNNQSAKGYENYGGRGIEVCNEWEEDFMSFYRWAISNGYNEELTIDRKDNNGNYEPSNCRWITRKSQCNNKNNNRLITYLGETKTIMQWCEELKLPFGAIRARIARGYNENNIFSPIKQTKKLLITINGQTKTPYQWEKETGMSEVTIKDRFKRGLTGDDLIYSCKYTKHGKGNHEVRNRKCENL